MMRYPPYDIRRRDWLELSDRLMGYAIAAGAWAVTVVLLCSVFCWLAFISGRQWERQAALAVQTKGE